MSDNYVTRYAFSPPDSLEKLDITVNDKNRPERDKDSIYFKAYGNLDLHNALMKDRQRVGFYYRAIVLNPQLFKGKTVLDVGCGLGILSMFAAQAGAKKVYAVEGSEKIGKLAEEAFWENQLDDIIETKIGKIEDAEIDAKIDIIVSEWMGYCLLYELMLPSVIFARDKYKPEIMIPGQASLLVCGFFDEEYFQERYGWTKSKYMDWLDMSSWAPEVSRQIVTKQCLKKTIVTTSATIGKLDLYSISQSQASQIKEIEFELRFRDKSANAIHGLVVYFETHFQGREGKVTLTNAPSGDLTHWLQSVCLFEEPVKANFYKRSVKGKFKLYPISECSRGIKIEVELDPKFVDTKKRHYKFVLP